MGDGGGFMRIDGRIPPGAFSGGDERGVPVVPISVAACTGLVATLTATSRNETELHSS
jgi:hypothetical protein